MSGWNYLWIFIFPFLALFTKNVFFLVGFLPHIYWLFFKAGDNRTNQYGPNPLQGSNVGINYGEPKANPMFEAIWRAEIEMPLMSSPLNGNDFLGKWTENEEKANRVSNQVEAGVIWVNCWLVRDLRTPFGGMKQSGMGREGGSEALRFFTEQKNVCTSTV